MLTRLDGLAKPEKMFEMSEPPSRPIPRVRFLAAALLTGLFLAWAISANADVTRPNTDPFQSLDGLPDPTQSGIEEHLSWALGVIDGEPVDVAEVEDRFAQSFLDQIPADSFATATAPVLVGAPYEFLGFAIADGGIFAEVALLDAAGVPSILTLAVDPTTPDKLAALVIAPVEPPLGPLALWEFSLHVAAGLTLLATAAALWFSGRARSSAVVALAGGLWLGQLLELAQGSILYSVGLIAGPVAAGVLALAVVSGPDGRVAGRLNWLAAGFVSAAVFSSLLVLTAVDTSVLTLPDQFLGFAPDRSRANAFARASGWVVSAAAATVAVAVLVRQFRADWTRDRGLVAATLGGTSAAVLVAIPAVSAGYDPGAFDFSQSSLFSIAAIVAGLGLAGSALWDRYDLGEVAEELAAENQELHGELAAQLLEVQASRARIVTAGEAARRQIERDLHDGAQQRLLAVVLALRVGRDRFAKEDPELKSYFDSVADDLGIAVAELRELARGLHPAILDEGIAAAAESLAESSSIPVTVTASKVDRCAIGVEQTAYFVISEALTNAVRHSNASHIAVDLETARNSLSIVISDDGSGGAALRDGSGLQGLEDRTLALGGTWSLSSPPGKGTAIKVTIPCE